MKVYLCIDVWVGGEDTVGYSDLERKKLLHITYFHSSKRFLRIFEKGHFSIFCLVFNFNHLTEGSLQMFGDKAQESVNGLSKGAIFLKRSSG
jgi:hypothetical protein